MEGVFGFESKLETVQLNDGSSIDTHLFAARAIDVDIFAGMNGPSDNEGATGLSLSNANVTLALLKPEETQDSRSWMALKADMDQGAFIGVDGLDASITDFIIQMNRVDGDETKTMWLILH
jgi:hypothetical protein